jgi:hypothetical protein
MKHYLDYKYLRKDLILLDSYLKYLSYFPPFEEFFAALLCALATAVAFIGKF